MSDDSREPRFAMDEGPGVGARLKAAREAQGLRVDTAAESLGFPRAVIVALEADDYTRLGQPVYIRGYLRKYAHFLDLSGDELIADYERGSAPRDPELRARLTPVASRRGNRRWPALVATLIIIAAVVVAGLWAWRYLRQAREVTHIPAAAAASAAPAFLPRGLNASPSSATGRIVADRSESAADGFSTIVPPTLPGTAAAPAPVPQDGLVLRLRDTSWIEVKAADQTRLYYNLAPAGKTLEFNGKHGALTVFLGNAPGVDVVVNGRPFQIPADTRSGNTARFTVTLAKPAATASG